MSSQKKLIVLVGPTAVGKTPVAIQLAIHFQTEILSADSRQIFRELTIGTAKPSPAELDQVRHHFINTQSIIDPYDAAQFGHDALSCIHKLFREHNQVVLCGGSGLYIKAVCEGFDDIPHITGEIRDQLFNELRDQGITSLQEKLRVLDPEHFRNIDTKNPQRLMRALEVILGTGVSISTFQNNAKLNHNFAIIKIGLWLPREALYQRIDERMEKMIDSGLFEEAKSLYKYKHYNALQTVGYQEIFDFIDGKYDREEAVRLLKRNSRRYAKRQLTWFNRDTNITWLDPRNIGEMIALVNK